MSGKILLVFAKYNKGWLTLLVNLVAAGGIVEFGPSSMVGFWG